MADVWVASMVVPTVVRMAMMVNVGRQADRHVERRDKMVCVIECR